MNGETLAMVATGSSNVSVNGIANAQRDIAAAIQGALAQAPDTDKRIAALCLGVSGLHSERERELFARWARAEFAPRVAVVNDVELVLAAGTPEGWGIAVIAGTGSHAFARTRSGRTTYTGGWGYLIGDEGSGGELGREAVRTATHAADGRGQPTRLLDEILRFWNLREPPELIGHIYQTKADGTSLRPAEFASLAPPVLELAEEGDAVAQSLVMRTADALAAHVLTLAHRLPFESRTIPLALGGGLLVGARRIQSELARACANSEYKFSPIGLAAEPVAGAVKLAMRLLSTRHG